MGDYDQLLAEVIKNPDDDTVRLVFADKLDEIGGEANAAWAKLIRKQIVDAHQEVRVAPYVRGFAGWYYAVGQGRRFGMTGRELRLAARAAAPPDYFKPWFCSLEISRGFVATVAARHDAFLAEAGRLFRRHPVAGVRLADRVPARLNALLGEEAGGDQPPAQPGEDDHVFYRAGDCDPGAVAASRLAAELYDLLPVDREVYSSVTWVSAPSAPREPADLVGKVASRQRLRAGLSQACVAYGRAAAKVLVTT